MKNKIDDILELFNKQIDEITNLDGIEKIRSDFLSSKDSKINGLLKDLKNVDKSEKSKFGSLINDAKNKIITKINLIKNKIKDDIYINSLKKEKIDLTLPGYNLKFSNLHPLNLVIKEIKHIFISLGYELIDGNELETKKYCFNKLNLDDNHPALDRQDSFYIDSERLLRTHCTNMTARILTKLGKEKKQIDAAILSFGNVYRNDDDDATHSHQFMQVDGFLVGQNISFANLKWTLEFLCQKLFNVNTKIRMRPSYFPFTEPSVEVDISCVNCESKGCNICKNSGWIEILGAGMIAKEVFELNGIDPNLNQGFAFGIGVERIAMLKFKITNIRDFYENDQNFLKQFKFYGR